MPPQAAISPFPPLTTPQQLQYFTKQQLVIIFIHVISLVPYQRNCYLRSMGLENDSGLELLINPILDSSIHLRGCPPGNLYGLPSDSNIYNVENGGLSL
jgi:hypothetical protein